MHRIPLPTSGGEFVDFLQNDTTAAMGIHARNDTRRRTGRRITAAAALLAYVGATFGYPVCVGPARAAEDDALVARPVANPCCCGLPGECACGTCCSPSSAPAAASENDTMDLGRQPGFSALKCRGAISLWLFVSGSQLPGEPFRYFLTLPVTGKVASEQIDSLTVNFVPPDPPPRSILA
jgi:hypothetical protein